MNPISAEKILKTFPQYVREIHGPHHTQFRQISSLEKIEPQSLLFITQEKHLETALNSPATVVLVPATFKKENLSLEKTWLLSPNPELAMRFIKNEFFLRTPFRASHLQAIHPTAQIDSTVILDETAEIGPGVVISAGVEIGARSYIGANTVIEKNVKIGSDTTIHPLVYIGHSCLIGNHCEIMPQTTIGSEGYGYAHDEKGQHYRIPHSGRVVLHDSVHIGAGCAIDRGTIEDTVIGLGTKIDNQCHLAHNSVIGKNCLITAQFGMAGSSKIGNNFISGGKASVTGHVSITNNVQISGMSGVTKSIEEPGQYGGFPLQPLRDYLKTKAAMTHLHEFRKQFEKWLKSTKTDSSTE
jgi:UDP-3-O-[3-hydroxymyristoyl] glucosamine N-acyltransferase